jgi:GDP-L-fucose synthase
MPYSLSPQTRIFVAGHLGLVGSAVLRRLEKGGFQEVLTASRSECDLCNQADVQSWMESHRPEVVLLAAGKVGGIYANDHYPAEFLYQNIMIHANVIHASWKADVKRLLYLGSSCIYPKACAQPIKEEYLLTGPLEPTNEPYALAKISGIKMCDSYRRQYGCDFFSAMPTNLYGPHDNFDLKTSHVLPALIRKFHDAKVEGRSEVEVWGTGQVRREFLHVDDLADACLFLLEHYEGGGHINVGTGEDLTIHALAEQVREVVFPEASLKWNTAMPDGTPRKLLDISRLADLGWKSEVDLRAGIESTYQWFLGQVEKSAV